MEQDYSNYSIKQLVKDNEKLTQKAIEQRQVIQYLLDHYNYSLLITFFTIVGIACYILRKYLGAGFYLVCFGASALLSFVTLIKYLIRPRRNKIADRYIKDHDDRYGSGGNTPKR